MNTYHGLVFGCCHDFGDIMVWINLINLMKLIVGENLGIEGSLGLLSPFW